MAASDTAMSWDRFQPSESSAPHLIRLSRTRLFTARASTSSQKWKRLRKRPFPRREPSMESIAPSPNVANRQQTEANLVSDRSEIQFAFVHVGRKDRNPHIFALGDVHHDLVGVSHFAREQGGHELHRVMNLKIRRLVCQQGVCRAVGFVEAVL